MHIVGRRTEKHQLGLLAQSNKPEFLVVYGRRRVGKTYLISEFFRDEFAFRVSGLSGESLTEQLEVFASKLREYGLAGCKRPTSWLEAFMLLKELLSRQEVQRHHESGRRVIFIDEMPWFDTPRSGFKGALEFFWNDWACSQEDVLLIACGSATSWLAENLLEQTKGLYNRVTKIIDLQPFTLTECKEYLDWRDLGFSNRQVMESYMIYGGIPYYLNLFERGKSLAQNTDMLFFDRTGQLSREFDRLFSSLFRTPQNYVSVIRTLATKQSGLTRAEIASTSGLSGGVLTKLLRDLEICNFIRSYRDFTRPKKGQIFQLVDPFTLFYLRFVDNQAFDGWMEFINTGRYHAWTGLAFEMLCLQHIGSIKNSLGIAGVQTQACAWRSTQFKPAAQIDLLIDRRDDVINLCEMKYSEADYVLTAADERSIRNKMASFRAETGTKKAIHPVLITPDGAYHNEHFHSVILGEIKVTDWLN